MKIKITSILIMKLSNLLKKNNLSMEELDDIIFYSRQVPELQKQLNSLNHEVSRQKEKKTSIKF